jgi:KDO2-lipid IV(A) lauroyltransferase
VLLPTAVIHTDRMEGHLGMVLPPVHTRREGLSLRAEVQAVSQELTRQLEVLIRQAPAQWHLLQPNWPTDS